LGDRVGTIHDLANNSGQVVNHLTYDSFGNVVAQTNPATTTRYGFTGRELDLETGLYYYRARYYDGKTGRFLSEDPIGFESGDPNLYAYVGNSPVKLTDPSGHEPYYGQLLAGTDYNRRIKYVNSDNKTVTVNTTKFLNLTLPIRILTQYEGPPKQILSDSFVAEFRHEEGLAQVQYATPTLGNRTGTTTTGDDRGHILPFLLGGNGNLRAGAPANPDNFFWQNSNINRGAYNQFGQKVKNALVRYHERGECYPDFFMRYEADLHYNRNSTNALRPTGFDVSVKGVRITSGDPTSIFGILHPNRTERRLRGLSSHFDNPPSP
jgi:RHS repeat-associated protein